MKNLIISLIIALGVFACGDNTNAPSATSKSSTLSQEETLKWVEANVDDVLVKHTYMARNGLALPYRLYSPEANTNGKLPLVIFLHGRGDRGIDNGKRMFGNVGLFMNDQSLVAPNMQKDFPCYVLVPQCSDKTINEEWAKWEGNTPETPFKGLGKDGSYVMSEEPSESGAATLDLIDSIVNALNVDAERVYLIGLSMGGFGTWEYTARRPDLFAAAVPMAGFSDPTQVDKIKHIPFWIFHGGADESNPVDGSRNMYRILKAAQADVKYTEYEGAGHGESFKMAFSEPDLIPWMFSKRK